jgi:formate hydrogenlyase subunit 6/NADH:ubiquinone oxidoreductase subunit I
MPYMLPTILKNIFTGYATRLYPVHVREPFENARGHVVFLDDKCTMCGVCALRCPSVAITTNKEKNELVFYPLRCIVCEVCVEVCPSDAIELIYKWRPSFYDKPAEMHKSTRLEHLRESTDKAQNKEVEKGND